MAIGIQQAERFIAIDDSPFGPDALILTALTGEESLSRLFRFNLEMLSEDTALDATRILGQLVTFSVRRGDGSRRYFNGLVRSFSAGGFTQHGLRYYSAEVVPEVWLLTRQSDCRIFQEKTVKQIIEEVLSGAGVTNFETSGITGSHRTREYCVQYRETSFDFISRLMEEEGVFYQFRHENGRHTFVMADATTAYEDVPEGTVDFVQGDQDWDSISHWAHSFAMTTGGYEARDYNYLEPTANMSTTRPTVAGGARRELKLYDYPGRYPVKGDGDSIAEWRIQEEETGHERIVGAGRVRTFSPGRTFTLANVEGETDQQVLTWVRHEARDDTQIAGQGDRVFYTNTFTCMPASQTFRPPRVTPKAEVRGMQTAVVVGPSGREIHTDEHGRIKVQFHWDRYGQNDDNSSCWIRVAQTWAGPQWGAQFLPRLGHEVVVAFIEGDPDRPLVVGSVYNGQNRPPFTLPANKTQSGVRSRSSLNGSGQNCNEFRFEDKKGQEEVFLHAEKDLLHEVENDETIDIGHDQTMTVKNNRTKTIQDGNETITLEKGNRTTTLRQGNDTLNVDTGNRSVSITGTDSLDVTRTISMSGTQGVTIESNMSIELKVGANSIKIDQSGITIKGMMVKVNGSGMVQVQAGGILSLSGSMVKIN